MNEKPGRKRQRPMNMLEKERRPWSERLRNITRVLQGRQPRYHMKAEQAAIFRALAEQTGGADRDDSVDNHSWAFREIRRGRSVAADNRRRRLQDEARNAYMTSPLWANMLNLTLAYTLGEQVTIAPDDPNGAAAPLLESFSKHPSSIIKNARTWALRLMLDGSVSAPAIVVTDKGHVHYRMWHPREELDVDFRGDDTVPDSVILANSSAPDEGRFILVPGDSAGKPRRMEVRPHVIREDIKATNDDIWRAIALRPERLSKRKGFNMRLANRDPLLDGNCLYYRWNWGVEARGLPAFVSGLDFVKRYQTLLYDEAFRVEMLKDHIWEYTLKGEDQAELDKRTAEDHVAAPGKFIYTSEVGQIKAHTPDIKSNDTVSFFKLLRDHISMETGLGPFFFGENELNFATAMAQQLPGIKVLQQTQARLVEFFRLAIDYQLHTWQYFGALDPWDDIGYKVVVPELSEDMFLTKMQSLQAMGAAFEPAARNGWEHHEVLSDMWFRAAKALKLTTDEQALAAQFGTSEGKRRSAPDKPAVGMFGPQTAEERTKAVNLTQDEENLVGMIRTNPELAKMFAKARPGNRIMQNSLEE